MRTDALQVDSNATTAAVIRRTGRRSPVATFGTLALCAILLAAACAAEAKGIFQAQGKIADVREKDDSITFRFTGWISFGYATAPEDNPKRRWKDLRWDYADVTVQVGNWTQRTKPFEKATQSDAAQILRALSELASAGRQMQFSIDNPTLSFSNRGELVGVSGTYVYASPLR